jgi:exonuclease SbcC
LISINENKISAKQQELLGLDEKEKAEKISVDEKIKSEIEKEEIRIGKAAKYLEEHEEIDIDPLQEEANNIQEMVSYLRDWDRIIEIRDNQLAPKERYSDELTAKIDKARTLPSELLKTAKMPIEGISVDTEGNVRINGTLISDLSDGEKLEIAMKVAKAQCGSLKVICMDKWESLDTLSQEALLKEMTVDEYQYFVTEVAVTENGEIEVEKIG